MAGPRRKLFEDAGLAVPWSAREAPVPRLIARPIQRFTATEIAGGVVLALAAAVALVWANSPASESYHQLLETELGLELGGWELRLDLHHWVNDLLMAVFFFVVGLEIKREVVHGELRDPRAAALPVIAALGGLAVPAAIYAVLNAGGPGANGWGIPMATDIAFALGALALLGRRVPASLHVFLLTLAVADDLGAIAVIAIFYSQGVAAAWLAAAAAAALAIVALNRAGVRWLVPYVVLAGFLWLATLESGVHATIAGVLLGLLTPAHPFHPPRRAAKVLHGQLDTMVAVEEAEPDVDEYEMLEVTRLSRESVSPLARLETMLHPWTAFLVLPVFALANAGVDVRDASVGELAGNPVTLGVVLGLVMGKPLGILAAAWLATRLRLGLLPAGAGWVHIAGVGLLAGIGFTVALFIAELSFTEAALTDAAKVGILVASAGAAVLGLVALRLAPRHQVSPPPPMGHANRTTNV
jgi:NhaA family Na+:H+ antiporter